ncbi:M23 family metallopeptidase [Nonomuraea sp. NEAU-A123]|uniref:M23 family metallopeptidase n=1 Tax=Nonomuraea sp. NEAU-A123 TaxID=2839649 RepID=UPI002032C04C|nr:M23 family metallopeptidase [Nonomuraea sp. NEAU-A123]
MCAECTPWSHRSHLKGSPHEAQWTRSCGRHTVIRPRDGVVAAANQGSTNGFGNLVKIDHGGGYATGYAHLNSFSVNAGPVTASAAVKWGGKAGSSLYNSPSEHCGS